MSTQRFHFLTIIGRAAAEVEAACDSLLALRVPDHPRGVGGTDYGPAALARVEGFCKSLLHAADALPVLHHATHIDGWATGNWGLTRLPWPDRRVRAALGLNYGVACYPSRQAPALRAAAARARRRAARRARTFDSWYEDAVTLAIDTGVHFRFDYLVVAVAECLGGSREDYEIEASLKVPLPGVPRGRGKTPSRAKQVRANPLGARFV
jgi:hypothetical protein